MADDGLTSSMQKVAHSCPACGSEVAPGLLSCPSCRRLVHANRLNELADTAEVAERDGDWTGALASWNDALALLPSDSRQHAAIAGRISKLARRVEAGPLPNTAAAVPKAAAVEPSASPPSRWSGGAVTGILGTLALAAWKFKFAAVMLLGKAKFLLLGLTKASTFLSMFMAVGVYWTVFGGWFALGLVLSIYVHEMGHVAALMRYGIRASAPLFIPGLGAFIRLKQAFIDPRLDARVGLAGPIWGLGAAVVCAGLYVTTDQPIFAALARFGAWVNLFNLMPIWQLDGGRAFRSLNRPQRWLATAALATAWSITEDGLLILLTIAGVVRTAMDKPNDKPDNTALAQYIALVAALSALAQLPVALPHR
jgi:Zn-dependent protease